VSDPSGVAQDPGASFSSAVADIPTLESQSVVRPSPIALVVGIVALVASLAIWFLFPSSFPLAVLGYLLTPFLVVATLAWARAMHMRKSPNPWYDRASGESQQRLLQLLTALAFLVGMLHIWRIATEVASWFS